MTRHWDKLFTLRTLGAIKVRALISAGRLSAIETQRRAIDVVTKTSLFK